MPAGRPPKPLETHETEGTFRADRHGDKSRMFRPDGQAEKPASLKGDASKLWDAIVPELSRKGLATAIDTAELTAMCDWYARYVKLGRQYAQVGDHRMVTPMRTCWDAFAQIASKFGLTPSDRARLSLPKETKQAVISRIREAEA